MGTFSNSKVNPRNILGGIPGLFDESEFERESSLVASVASSISQAAGGVFEVAMDIGQNIVGTESKQETNGKFPTTGSIEFNNKEIQTEQKVKAESDRKRAFFQALKEEQDRAQRAKEKLIFEEEINDMVTNLPTDQKNELLHYQASYRDRSIYQRAELRKKIIEQRKKTEKQEKAASIPSPAKQPSAMEGAFEGRSGNQGGGTANLSNQAVG
jgi:hypothetical protein